ncbi:hypothetical Protein YC6258_01676 [Gynuella sunshinyii YC6258]|uniref:Uncharacterized protein n=2 Tax=Gynuella sunshinyii TaxID=1445505 RepID=A0A0C5VTS9_9GAMM|nr:hypothetical Protein YC6258_01676 [Gynuella sunshinyii YC6258]
MEEKMPGTYKVTDNGKTLFVKWQGSLLDSRLLDLTTERYQDARLRNGMTEVIDTRSAMIERPADKPALVRAINQMATVYQEIRKQIKIARMLVVAPDQLMFEHVSEFRLLMARQSVDVILFSSSQSLSYFLPYSPVELEDIFVSLSMGNLANFRQQA